MKFSTVFDGDVYQAFHECFETCWEQAEEISGIKFAGSLNLVAIEVAIAFYCYLEIELDIKNKNGQIAEEKSNLIASRALEQNTSFYTPLNLSVREVGALIKSRLDQIYGPLTRLYYQERDKCHDADFSKFEASFLWNLISLISSSETQRGIVNLNVSLRKDDPPKEVTENLTSFFNEWYIAVDELVSKVEIFIIK